MVTLSVSPLSLYNKADIHGQVARPSPARPSAHGARRCWQTRATRVPRVRGTARGPATAQKRAGAPGPAARRGLGRSMPIEQHGRAQVGRGELIQLLEQRFLTPLINLIKNKGANPLDIMCGAFGTCQEITYKMYGTVMGIPINSVSAEVKAPCDLRGLVGALATR